MLQTAMNESTFFDGTFFEQNELNLLGMKTIIRIEKFDKVLFCFVLFCFLTLKIALRLEKNILPQKLILFAQPSITFWNKTFGSHFWRLLIFSFEM